MQRFIYLYYLIFILLSIPFPIKILLSTLKVAIVNCYQIFADFYASIGAFKKPIILEFFGSNFSTSTIQKSSRGLYEFPQRTYKVYIYLYYSGFTEEDFSLLTSITSWCTCGSGKPRLLQGEQVVLQDDHRSPSLETIPSLDLAPELEESTSTLEINLPCIPSKDR